MTLETGKIEEDVKSKLVKQKQHSVAVSESLQNFQILSKHEGEAFKFEKVIASFYESDPVETNVFRVISPGITYGPFVLILHQTTQIARTRPNP